MLRRIIFGTAFFGRQKTDFLTCASEGNRRQVVSAILCVTFFETFLIVVLAYQTRDGGIDLRFYALSEFHLLQLKCCAGRHLELTLQTIVLHTCCDSSIVVLEINRSTQRQSLIALSPVAHSSFQYIPYMVWHACMCCLL